MISILFGIIVLPVDLKRVGIRSVKWSGFIEVGNWGLGTRRLERVG